MDGPWLLEIQIHQGAARHIVYGAADIRVE
jgi:hypothetical protein